MSVILVASILILLLAAIWVGFLFLQPLIPNIDFITGLTDFVIDILDFLTLSDFISSIFNLTLNEFHDIMSWFLKLVIYLILWLAFIFISVILTIWLERKAMGRFMDRRSTQTGPFPYGLLQNIADFLKLLGKEILFPDKSDRLAMLLALALIVTTSIAAFVAIPLTGFLFVSDPPMGFLLVFAIFSLYPIAVALLGWASNSKYTLLGGFRSAAQLLSYEIPMVLSLAGAVLIVNAGKLLSERSFSLLGIVEFQADGLWFTFLLPIGALVFTIATIAEAERVPFDLPEGESELVMGWRTELTAILYMFAMLGEYLHMFMMASLSVLIFFGGWTMPFPELTRFIHPAVWFTIKVFILLFIEIWVRAALPRVRIDQLLDFGWKVLVPLSIINLLLAGLIAFDPPGSYITGYILTLVVIVVLFIRWAIRKDPDFPETYRTEDHKRKSKKAEQGVKT